jgi:1,4-alpha-glucan branching enzyme
VKIVWTMRSISSPSAVSPESGCNPAAARRAAEEAAGIDAVGDLAIVLHSHMPYVEGFGTYPFGEEWLFDAVARSHLPVLASARDLTMTVTPVLADQLEADGVPERMQLFLREHRVKAAERDAAEGPEELRPAALAEAHRYERSLARLDELGGDVNEAFRAAHRERGVALMASSATHAVLPLLATLPGQRLQVDTGLRSHGRRFGSATGFWLPECAYRPGIEAVLAERGVRFFCTDQSAHEVDPADALAPAATPAGPVAFTIDWEAVSIVWSLDGYPSNPAYADFHRSSVNGTRLWTIDDRPYDPEAAADRAGRHAIEFADWVAERLDAYRRARGRPGLVTFAIDTELLGHWWTEGPAWLRAVLDAAPERRIRLVTLPGALSRHEPESRPLRASTWGERKDFSTWDAPPVADLAWAARRLELRLLREVGAGSLSEAAAARAARELLAIQSSDWAFLDSRRQAGDYPYRRATGHAEALLEAIDSAEPPDPRMRNLAPDLSLAPLLET